MKMKMKMIGRIIRIKKVYGKAWVRYDSGFYID